MKKYLTKILVAIIFLTIIACFIGILINNNKEKAKTANMTQEEIEYKEYEDTIIEKLQDMSEIERMQVYLGEFLTFMEIGQYQKAYDNLNDNFKNTYFKDLETFKSYAERTYPKDSTVEYEDYERYGDIYILKVKISDIINNDYEPIEQNIVLHEFSAHNYKISFEVKEGEDEPQS